jgi:hypothetical protein
VSSQYSVCTHQRRSSSMGNDTIKTSE